MPDRREKAVKQAIVDFHMDEESHWVATLACGHTQHVRHRPPWINRRWVTTEAGRRGMLGHILWCKRCRDGEPAPDVAAAVRPAIPHWHALHLDNALLADPNLEAVEAAFRQAFHARGEPENMALFIRPAPAGQQHRSLVIYFTPAAEPLARELGATPCRRPPDPSGLKLQQGAPQARALLADIP